MVKIPVHKMKSKNGKRDGKQPTSIEEFLASLNEIIALADEKEREVWKSAHHSDKTRTGPKSR